MAETSRTSTVSRLAEHGERRARRVSPWGLLRDTVLHWWHSDVPMQSAALAFYTVFSLAPVLVISVAIAGSVFGSEATRDEVARQVGVLAGAESAEMVSQVLESAARPDLSKIAGVIGVVTLLFGATAVFGQLQQSLNTIWEVKPKPGQAVRGFLRKRLLSLGLVVAIGFLLLVSLVMSTAVSALGAFLQRISDFPVGLLGLFDFMLSLVVITALFMLIFRTLPDAMLSWRNVAFGAAVTALLFAVGKELIGLYVGRASVASAYGVAGSLVLLLLWVYYSAMLLLLGACFTRVWSRRQRPAGVRPEPGAQKVERVERPKRAGPARQGAPARS